MPSSAASRPAYAVCYLRDVNFGDDIAQYMREIDETLRPHRGQFIVHGGELDAREGNWDGTLVIVAFPSRDDAVRWYESVSYQRIAPLRLNNSLSCCAIVDGVAPGHTARDKLSELQSM